MKTPDGQEFESRGKERAPALLGRIALSALKLVGKAVIAVGRAVGKIIATTWRLAGALDAALWRGLKLGSIVVWRSLAAICLVMASALGDLIKWMPSRWGRAYSAGSGVVLIIGALWIVDNLRFAAMPFDALGERARAPLDLEDPILARIEGRYVHLSEVASAAVAEGALREGETLTPNVAFERKLVQAYVEQRLLAREAIDLGMHQSLQIARQLNAARDRILAAAYMEERLAESVTDEAVDRLYRAQSDVTRLGDEVRARQIVVPSREQAEDLLAQLNAGASFEDLARRYSIDRSTAPIGGEIGYFTRDMMTPSLAAAAFSTPAGNTAPLFETEFGWHLLEVLDRRRTTGIPLDAVEDNIRRFLTLRVIEATVAQLRQDYDVVYYVAEPNARVRETGRTSSPGGDSRD